MDPDAPAVVASPLRDRMIFAFGAPRSGTFLLHRLLTAHPDVAAVPSETHLFSHGIEPLWERFHHGPRASTDVARMYADREALLSATRAFCDGILGEHLAEDAQYLCERSPGHVVSAATIAAVYPDARLVHIVRDGRDVARSQASQTWGSDLFEEGARRWAEDVRKGRRAAALGSRYVELRYETLAGGGDGAVRDVYERVGLPVTPDALTAGTAALETERNVDPAGGGTSAEKWRTLLSREELAGFDAIAGDLLAELGYPPSDSSDSGAAAARPADPAVSVAPVAARQGRGLLERLRPGSGDEEVSHRKQLQAELRSGQRVLDAVVDALARGGDTGSVLAPDATVRWTWHGADREAHGPDAHSLMREIATDDPAFASRQLRSDVHVGVPCFTAVLGYEGPDGGTAWRVVAVAARDGRARSVRVYALP